MEIWFIGTLIFVSLLLALFLGLPVAFSCGGIATAACLFVWGPRGLYSIVTTAYGEMTIFIFLAVPLFILMAEVIHVSGIAKQLFELMYYWMGSLRGGLAMGTVFICAVFAAMVGVSTASTASMGVVTVPPMLTRGYDNRLIAGVVAAGGALGILIPPSVLMIVLGSVVHLSVGKLFLGGVFPGILLALFFIVYIAVISFLRPNYAPAISAEKRVSWRKKLMLLKNLFAPGMLIVGVLGGIYLGICTPTEAAGIGALGAIIISAGMKKLKWNNLDAALKHTLLLTCMVLWITIGAVSLTKILQVTDIINVVQNMVLGWEFNRWIILVGMQIIFFILGMFLDPVGIIMITAPIFFPIVESLGFDPLWFGVLFIINMEMAYITPPFGFNLFVLRGIVQGTGISMRDIYWGIIPFVVCQMICLALMMIFPDVITWLPDKLIQ